MIRTLKLIGAITLLAGIAATIRYSGVWRDLPDTQGFIGIALTCFPFALFAAALIIARSRTAVICSVSGLLLALCFGLSNYYEAFWSPNLSDVNGIVIITIPIWQAIIALILLVISFKSKSQTENTKPHSNKN